MRGARCGTEPDCFACACLARANLSFFLLLLCAVQPSLPALQRLPLHPYVLQTLQNWHKSARKEAAPSAGRRRLRRGVRRSVAAAAGWVAAGCDVVEAEEGHGGGQAQQGAHEHSRHALLYRTVRVVRQPARQRCRAWEGGREQVWWAACGLWACSPWQGEGSMVQQAGRGLCGAGCSGWEASPPSVSVMTGVFLPARHALSDSWERSNWAAPSTPITAAGWPHPASLAPRLAASSSVP